MGGKMGSCDFKDLTKLRDKIEKLEQGQLDIFMEACAKELAARLLTKVIKRTPVGEYDKPVDFITSDGRHVSFDPHSGKVGGTLRRGWTAGTDSGGRAYANNLTVFYYGGVYVIEIVNPVEYASYVEFGHRTRNGGGWVEGKFMMTISEQEIEAIAPKVLETRLMKMLGEVFK